MKEKFKPYIKVCGMRDPENLKQLLKLNPDYVGFILYPKSKRFLGMEYELTVDIPPSIKKVGVFVNALIDDVFFWVNRLNLDLLQLHGDEPVEYCKELQKLKIPMIKAFGIDESFDFSILAKYESYCEYFLFDTKTAALGGSGKHFNWDLLKGYTSNKPFFLSGGIGTDDVDALKTISGLSIHSIDINSRFEDSPGMKNIEMLRRFITEFRL